MRSEGKKIGVLIESGFYEREIFDREHRWPEESWLAWVLTRS